MRLLLSSAWLAKTVRMPEPTYYHYIHIFATPTVVSDMHVLAIVIAIVISRYIEICHYSTETGSIPSLRPRDRCPSEDWKYIKPHPAAEIEFRPSIQGLFEAFIAQNSVFEKEQPIFKIFTHLREYSITGLWAAHPSKDGLWTY